MPSESVHVRQLRLPVRSRPHGPAHAPVAGALRAVESFLLRGGQQTARRNAWAAVVADRQRAEDRREAEYAMNALVSGVRGDAVRE